MTNDVIAHEVSIPWMGVSTPVEGLMTAKAALKAAKLDWTVSTNPVQTIVNGKTLHIPNRRAIVRDSDQEVYGVVSTDYTPYQNKDVFSFLDTLVDDGSARYESAGSTNNGRRVFMTMRLDDFNVAGEDAHSLYLVTTNAHDGLNSFKSSVTAIRLRCTNMVSMAMRTAKTTWSLTHRADLKGKAQEAREALQLTLKYKDEFQAEVERMLEVEINKDKFLTIVEDILPEQKNATEKKLEILSDIWDNEPTNPEGDNAWKAMNTFTYWTDHSNFRTNEARMTSLVYGTAAGQRTRLHQALMANA